MSNFLGADHLSGSILPQNLVCPKPYTIYAPETKTTDPTERRIKKMSDSQEAENKMKLNTLTSRIRINLKKQQR